MPGYAKPPSYNSNNITITPVGNISSTILQEGIAELDSEKNAKNLLYNGAMQVAQRGTSTTSITTSGYYTADRWYFNQDGTIGTWTSDIQADAPTGTGLRKSLRMLVTTANTSLDASDFLAIDQRLEGQNLQQIAKGTASAKQLTLSFWVKSNVTGTYIAELGDVDNTRQVSAAYTISAPATWERKTITFPADTTGAFDNDNALSLNARFALAMGSNYTSGTLQTTWASTVNANRYVGQTNLSATLNNYWQVTGVQLEVGPIASPFDFKLFGQELAECQRYYCKTFPQATAPAQSAAIDGVLSVGTFANQGASISPVNFVFPVEMRAAPTISTFTPLTAGTGFRGSNGTVYAASVDFIGQRQATLYNTNNIAVNVRLDVHAVASAEL